MRGERTWTGPPTPEEIAVGRAFIAHRDCPTEATSAAFRRSWFALTGGIPITTPTRCANCGLHRTAMTPEIPCRQCGQTRERAAK